MITIFENANFFAVLPSSNNTMNIKRVMLTRGAQDQISELFSRETNKILDAELERIRFDGNYKPDNDEILEIRNFDIPGEIEEALREPTSFEGLELEQNSYPKVKGIFTGIMEPEIQVSFQNFTQAQYISRKGLNLIHSRETFRLFEGIGINIPYRIDCIYNQGSLLFHSYHNTKQILDLSAYYREATDSDIEEFVRHPSIAVEDSHFFKKEVADSWTRKKVASIRDSGTLNRCSPQTVREKASEYNVDIQIDGDRIILPKNKKEAKQALRFLDEDIFRGPLTEEKYLTNSKRPYYY